MMANGRITKYAAMDSINGKTVEDTSGIGKVTLWTNSECIHGKMVECTKVSTRKIRSTGSGCTHGQTERDMQAGGVTGNNMASGFLCHNKVNEG